MCRTGEIVKRVMTACLALSASLLAGLPSTTSPVKASNHLTYPAPSKLLCMDEPILSSPAICNATLSPEPFEHVFYAIKLGGVSTPAGGPFTLLETLPNGFQYLSAYCTVAGSGQLTPLNRTVLNLVSTFSSITLLSGQTVYCFIRGYFDNPGASVTNFVTVADGNGVAVSTAGQHNANVATTSALQSDLSVVKTVTPGSVDITSGVQSLTYTVEIYNNGPQGVWIGAIFELFDTISISSAGVPMQVRFVTASGICTASVNTDCLDPTPVTVASTFSTVTTVPLTVAQWQFPSAGPNADGEIPTNGKITLSYKIEVRRHPELFCAKGGEALINKAFFGLTRINGVTVTDIDDTNNTSASPDVQVETGLQIDPDCALPDLGGPIKIFKKQIFPQPVLEVPWSTNSFPNPSSIVRYQVTVTNSDVNPINVWLQDRVMQWAGTPPFSWIVDNWDCVLPAACTTGLPVNVPTPTTLFSYFSTKKVWDKVDLTVPGRANNINGEVVLNIWLKFKPKSCDSFAAGGNIIRNYGRVKYNFAGSSFMTEAFVDTKMKPRPLCKLQVKKTVVPNTKKKVIFGSTIKYTMTYVNNDAFIVRVGTLIDAVRIVQSNYAASLPFIYRYKCVVGFGIVSNSPGTMAFSNWISGSIVHTPLPSQGTRLIQNTSVMTFSPGARLDCTVEIRVFRPVSGDAKCLSSVTPRLENLALMDVSDFYNPNLQWPPSLLYTSSHPWGATQPTPVPVDLTNWSTVGLKLPKCYKFVVNKTVTPNLTWAPGGPTITYTVEVQNQGQLLTGQMIQNTWYGPVIRDQFLSPSSGSIVPSSVSVNPVVPCSIPANQLNWDGPPAQSRLRISNFPPGCTIRVKFDVKGPFTPGNHCNRGSVSIQPFSFAQQDWYSNSTNPILWSVACATVLKTASLTVTKVIINNSGDVLPASALFPVTVSCLVPFGPTIVFSVDVSSTAPILVKYIPVGSVCTITESSTLPLPTPGPGLPLFCQPPAVLEWQQPTYAPFQTVQIKDPPFVNAVTITNTLNCNRQGLP